MRSIFLLALTLLTGLPSPAQETFRPSKKDLASYKVYLRAKLKTYAPGFALDSFTVIGLDTITEADRQRAILEMEIDRLQSIKELLGSMTELQQLELESAQRWTGEDDNLAKTYLRKAQEAGKKVEVLAAKSKEMYAKTKARSEMLGSADSVKPVGYSIKCNIQIHGPDRAVDQQTVYITLNKNKDVINRETFLLDRTSTAAVTKSK